MCKWLTTIISKLEVRLRQGDATWRVTTEIKQSSGFTEYNTFTKEITSGIHVNRYNKRYKINFSLKKEKLEWMNK